MPVNLTEGGIVKATRDVMTSGERRDLSDAGCPGLRLRLTAKGAASWVLACRDREGRMRRFVLGQYQGKKGMGLAAARDAARKLHVEIKSGAPDPIAEKRKALAIGRDAKDGIGTLAGLIAHYEVKKGGKLRSWRQQRQAVENVFRKHLDRPLATMTAADLQVTADAHNAEYAAALAVRCLRPILKWASTPSRGFAPAGLAELQQPATVRRRERILTQDELATLLPVLRRSERPYAAAMMFMLWTLARREEVCGARWRDIAADIWTIPAAAAKNAKEHKVTLPRQALELLRSRLPTDGSKPDLSALIFATSTGAPLGNWDRETKALQSASGITGWTRHDLRRTGATMLGEMGVLPDLIEAALNHVSIRSSLAATYNQSRYRPQVAEALQMLADRLESIETGEEKVVPIRPGLGGPGIVMHSATILPLKAKAVPGYPGPPCELAANRPDL